MRKTPSSRRKFSLEERIRITAHSKVRVFITSKKRSRKGYLIKGPAGYTATAPSRSQAMQMLWATLRCHEPLSWIVTYLR